MKYTASLAFVLVLVFSAMFFSTSAATSTVVLNLEWVLWGSSMLVFALAGYSFVQLMSGERHFTKGRIRKRHLWDDVLIIATLAVAAYLLWGPRRRVHGGFSVGHRLIQPFRVFLRRGDLVIIDAPIHTFLYLVPYLVFLAFVVYGLLKRQKLKRYPLAEKFNPQMTYETLEGTPAERIIKMYQNVVAGLVRRGYPYQKSWTHWEHEDKLREIFPDLRDLDALTRLFEKAKYAERLKAGDLELAKESYERLMEFLR